MDICDLLYVFRAYLLWFQKLKIRQLSAIVSLGKHCNQAAPSSRCRVYPLWPCSTLPTALSMSCSQEAHLKSHSQAGRSCLSCTIPSSIKTRCPQNYLNVLCKFTPDNNLPPKQNMPPLVAPSPTPSNSSHVFLCCVNTPLESVVCLWMQVLSKALFSLLFYLSQCLASFFTVSLIIGLTQ